MKRSARKHSDGSFQDGEKDEGVGEYITVRSPEDRFKLNIDVNFQLLDYTLLVIKDDDTVRESVNESIQTMRIQTIVSNVPYCLILNPKMISSIRCTEYLKSCDNFFNICHICVTGLNVVLTTWLFHTKMRSVCLANQEHFNRTKAVTVTQKKTKML